MYQQYQFKRIAIKLKKQSLRSQQILILHINTMNKTKKIPEIKQVGPGRPSQKKYQFQQKGVVQEPLVTDEFTILECIMQHPLYLKCITNIVKQIDKNNNINFAFTNNYMYMWIHDSDLQYNCYMQLKCDQMLSYYLDLNNHQFIKFDIPVSHVQNTFNFYNRSSVKTEIRIKGPDAPIFKIDSYKSEKKNISCITNTNYISINPSNEQLDVTENFFKQVGQSGPSLKILSQMNRIDKMRYILYSSKLFSNCFFGKYFDKKFYSFSFLNSDMRKFITEIQKDCQKISIRRHIQPNVNEAKSIIMEAKMPGSSSVKQLNGINNNFIDYKSYQPTPETDDVVFELGTGILKQITSNNPTNIIKFVMLTNNKIIVKIKNGFSLFKFELNCY